MANSGQHISKSPRTVSNFSYQAAEQDRMARVLFNTKPASIFCFSPPTFSPPYLIFSIPTSLLNSSGAKIINTYPPTRKLKQKHHMKLLNLALLNKKKNSWIHHWLPYLFSCMYATAHGYVKTVCRCPNIGTKGKHIHAYIN